MNRTPSLLAIMTFTAASSAACAGGVPENPRVGIAPPKRIEVIETPARVAGEPVDIASVPRAVRAAVVADAARRFAVPESAVVVLDAERVTWSDGSLGCPRPGMMYPQVLVPGFRLTARTDERVLEYHTDSRGLAITCDLKPRPVRSGQPALQPPKGVEPRTGPPDASAPER